MGLKSDKNTGKCRIIGGEWRSRAITFPAVEGLRPTHDRVRETVFNWLSSYIAGAHCLDLFAGSGVFGFEALSRGAASVTFVEREKIVVDALKNNALLLNASNAKIMYASFPDVVLQQSAFDIVFLDPPFQKNMLNDALRWVVDYLKPGALVYFEAEKGLVIDIPEGLNSYRYKSTASLQYGLLRSV